jgi:hypothetical protein
VEPGGYKSESSSTTRTVRRTPRFLPIPHAMNKPLTHPKIIMPLQDNPQPSSPHGGASVCLTGGAPPFSLPSSTQSQPIYNQTNYPSHGAQSPLFTHPMPIPQHTPPNDQCPMPLQPMPRPSVPLMQGWTFNPDTGTIPQYPPPRSTIYDYHHPMVGPLARNTTEHR